MMCQGNKYEAAEYAKRWDDSTPEVALYLKAAVAAGTVTDATWAAPLVNQIIADDFLALLRPATILGKIPGLRNVPFNTKVPAQTAGGTYGWVGEAKPKPVTKLAFSSETLGISKVAGIIVLTEELVRLSQPVGRSAGARRHGRRDCRSSWISSSSIRPWPRWPASTRRRSPTAPRPRRPRPTRWPTSWA